MVIEAIHAIVAQTAVRGTRWPEYLAGEAILQLDRLPLDEHLLGTWRRAVCGTVQRVWHFYIRNSRRRRKVPTDAVRKCSISIIGSVGDKVVVRC